MVAVDPFETAPDVARMARSSRANPAPGGLPEPRRNPLIAKASCAFVLCSRRYEYEYCTKTRAVPWEWPKDGNKHRVGDFLLQSHQRNPS